MISQKPFFFLILLLISKVKAQEIETQQSVKSITYSQDNRVVTILHMDGTIEYLDLFTGDSQIIKNDGA